MKNIKVMYLYNKKVKLQEDKLVITKIPISIRKGSNTCICKIKCKHKSKSKKYRTIFGK